ncbi:MAG: hypothetical protein JKY09_03215 [Crocinitomicaceae bacterium]|nr:hypothetical protein [Crocinitomicaceae bacterium]
MRGISPVLSVLIMSLCAVYTCQAQNVNQGIKAVVSDRDSYDHFGYSTSIAMAEQLILDKKMNKARHMVLDMTGAVSGTYFMKLNTEYKSVMIKLVIKWRALFRCTKSSFGGMDCIWRRITL